MNNYSYSNKPVLQRPVESTQYVSLKFLEELMLEGMLASNGRVGDAYESAIAASTIGLFKTEATSRRDPLHAGPFRNIDDIEYATMGWVDWYNNRRLHSALDYVQPVEFELNNYAADLSSQPEMSLT
jgi:transposase InsO family protein